MWTDAHCHLNSEYAQQGAEIVIERARAAGVTQLIAIGIGGAGQGILEAQSIAERHQGIWFTAGLHPHDAAAATESEIAILTQSLAHPKCVALGEVGLDYYYDHSPRAGQIALFERMIEIAVANQKPLMLHIRDAHQEAITLLKPHIARMPPGVVHCFSAGLETARAYLNLGFYLSIPGIATFKNARDLRAALPELPHDRVVLETDSPFLAPIPMRGKPNEPAFIPLVANALVEAWQLPLPQIATLTTDNANRLFKLHH